MATSKIFCPSCSSSNIRLPTPERPFYGCAICGQTFQLGPPVARAPQPDTQPAQPPQDHSSRLRNIVVGTTFFCALLFGTAAMWWFQMYQPAELLDGGSMRPTMTGDDQVVVNPWARNFNRGDLIVFKDPTKRDATLLKRVIGLPDEVIAVADGQVMINGQPIAEPWLADPSTQLIYVELTKIEPDHFFVLGDNRNISLDSSEFGPIPRKWIHSKVILHQTSEPFGIHIGEALHRLNRPSH